jgi:hypothetical protein
LVNGDENTPERSKRFDPRSCLAGIGNDKDLYGELAGAIGNNPCHLAMGRKVSAAHSHPGENQVVWLNSSVAQVWW